MRRARDDAPRYIAPGSKASDAPTRLAALLYVGCVALGGMGDCVALMESGVGTYMKGATAFAAAMAAIRFLRTGKVKRLKEIGRFAALFAFPLVFTLIVSLLIWACNAEPLWAISRGAQKLIFQGVNILAVLSAYYLFGGRAPYYYFYGIAIANALIIALAAAQSGVAGVVESVIDCYVHGRTYGFMKLIEIHDITYCMGLFMLYFICVEWKISPHSRPLALVAAVLFIAGYKRIAIPAFLIAAALWFALGGLGVRARRGAIYALSFALVAMGFTYIVFIKYGLFQRVMDALNIDTAGRSKIYAYIDGFYRVDPAFLGYGFEYMVALLRGMRDAGTQAIHVTAIHCDILKQYIELGFWGFWVWIMYTCVYQIRWYMRRYGEMVARLALILNVYAFATYMTDNTIYYFWISMSLRVIMLGFARSDRVVEEMERASRASGLITEDDAIRFAGDDGDG